MADIVCAPAAPNITVLAPCVKRVPVPFQAVAVAEFTFTVLVLPFSVPAVSVISPVKVCVRAAPRSSVPPVPLIVSAAPLIFPETVAVPPVLVMLTGPVVVKPPMVWAAVPVIVTPPVPLVSVPAVVRFPPSVKRLAPGVRVAPEVMLRPAPVPSTLAPLSEIAPVPLMITPPVPLKVAGHSVDTVLAEVPALYCSVAAVP